MNSTRPALVLALLASALAPAGCGQKATLVGKWQGTIPQRGAALSSAYEFTPDGKETITISGPPGAAGRAISVVVSGTYQADGADLTQTLTTMTMGGRSGPTPAHSSRPAPYTLDGDQLTVMDPTGKQPMTLTRVKG